MVANPSARCIAPLPEFRRGRYCTPPVHKRLGAAGQVNWRLPRFGYSARYYLPTVWKFLIFEKSFLLAAAWHLKQANSRLMASLAALPSAVNII